MAATSMESYLQALYSTVDAKKTPLPTSWSSTDKNNYIKLSNMHRRAIYKGRSRSKRDTSCVRSDHPIPLACGLYYFEVKVIDKGLKGSITIGVGTRQMNLSILPGMDKNSFGYLGTSGEKFWGSVVGTAYGPSFTTNDTIGCGVNLVNRQIFFTKNGENLGEAFSGSLFDASSVLGLYPTVGLQTTGEVVEANFGQSRFMYNIEKDINELKKKTASSITEFPIPNEHTEMPAVFQSWVFSYLMHQGYYSTAEALARSTGQKLGEEESSMKSRQRIQGLVSSGKIGEAIDVTQACFPTFLDSHPNLFFLLKVHHFVELIDTLNPKSFLAALKAAHAFLFVSQDEAEKDVELKETSSRDSHSDITMDTAKDDNVEIEVDGLGPSNAFATQGSIYRRRSRRSHGRLDRKAVMETIELERELKSQKFTPEDRKAVMKTIELGRELKSQKSTLEDQYGVNDANNNLLAKAFNLLSYTYRLLEGPLSELIDPKQQVLADTLNSAILEANQLPKKSILHLVMAHAKELQQTMAQNGIGASAFASIDESF